jgi:hypothetical protein
MRNTKPQPRIFEKFPLDVTCPICGTNDEGETVLVAIQGTQDDGICQAQPMHLVCAIAKSYNPEMKVAFSIAH